MKSSKRSFVERCSFLLLVVLMFSGASGRHRRVPDTTTRLGPSSEDKEVLNEALKLLNMGKKTLGLSTENPLQMMQLVDNSSAPKIQKVLQKPPDAFAPSGEQYLVLSGKNGQIKLDNYTNTTFPPEDLNIDRNNSDIEDMFRITMEKKYPQNSGKVFHKITIIESNQLKPFDGKQLPQHISGMGPTKRHKSRSLPRLLVVPSVRRKRMTEEPTAKHSKDKRKYYIKIALVPQRKQKHQFHPVIRPESDISSFDAFSLLLKDVEELDQRHRKPDEYSDEVALQAVLLNHLMKLKMNKEDSEKKSINYQALAIPVSVLAVLSIIVFLSYRKWRSLSHQRALNLFGWQSGEKIRRRFHLKDKLNQKLYGAPFNRIYYHLAPTEEPELEWQSEFGDWLPSQEELGEKHPHG